METVNYVSNNYKYYVAYNLIAMQEERRRRAVHKEETIVGAATWCTDISGRFLQHDPRLIGRGKSGQLRNRGSSINNLPRCVQVRSRAGQNWPMLRRYLRAICRRSLRRGGEVIGSLLRLRRPRTRGDARGDLLRQPGLQVVLMRRAR